MRRLCHEPGGGLAEVRLHLRQQRGAAGVNQRVVAGVEPVADPRHGLQPGEVGNVQLAR